MRLLIMVSLWITCNNMVILKHMVTREGELVPHEAADVAESPHPDGDRHV
jgi:hypothetical protein